MAFCELHYYSKALSKQTAASVILPQCENQQGPFAVWYLLHGLSDDHSGWMRRTSIERYVAHLPLIVVMPDGGRSFYCDAAQGYAYETAIVEDTIGYIDSVFHTKAERGGRCISGLSMGGYGALKLALRFPQLFCSAVSHSGALNFAHVYPDPNHEEFGRIIGDNPVGGPNDLYALAERCERSLLPALRIDCGSEDFLLDMNRQFHAHLEALGIAHEYEEYPGAHDWGYWDLHVQEAVAFQARQLRLGSEPGI